MRRVGGQKRLPRVLPGEKLFNLAEHSFKLSDRNFFWRDLVNLAVFPNHNWDPFALVLTQDMLHGASESFLGIPAETA